ncbi:hypothetical protein NSMM_500030 [Nitrosomonas mobilis]|uniref:Uncharacterized protein n=1 Tax=Nitrosomonas mobilis TaxID=51642 RepID=A0A1G5SH77_9PROT|nr:hypothetical protein NSMM_500030 [Nitrosomonas mobilis]
MTTKPFLGTFGSYEKGPLFFLYATDISYRRFFTPVKYILCQHFVFTPGLA